jgi:hypothetical protein
MRRRNFFRRLLLPSESNTVEEVGQRKGPLRCQRGKMARAPLRIAGVGVCLLGSLLLGPTTAMAEYDVKSALQLYDSADSDNRKVWELIFGNTYNGMRWANAVLAGKKQKQLFCEPKNVVLTGPEVTEMLRGQLNADPKFGELPFGFGIFIVLQTAFPCPGT